MHCESAWVATVDFLAFSFAFFSRGEYKPTLQWLSTCDSKRDMYNVSEFPNPVRLKFPLEYALPGLIKLYSHQIWSIYRPICEQKFSHVWSITNSIKPHLRFIIIIIGKAKGRMYVRWVHKTWTRTTTRNVRCCATVCIVRLRLCRSHTFIYRTSGKKKNVQRLTQIAIQSRTPHLQTYMFMYVRK
jgi:hypothetical protein